MGASDSPLLPFVSSLLTLVHKFAPPCAHIGVSQGSCDAVCKLDPAYDPGPVARTYHSARATVACERREALGQFRHVDFRGSIHSRAALPVLHFAPRLLS